MSWLYLDDHFGEDPRLLRVGPQAAWLHTQAMSYCARLLTDGHISEPAARSFSPRWKSLTEKLEAEGLWQKVDGGWNLPTYLEWNKTRAQVEEGRRERAEAGRKGGLRSGESRSKSEANASAGASRFASHNVEPQPQPRTQPKEEELASSSLRSEREGVANRLAAVFTKLGCTDEALEARLLADGAREVIIDKLELLAEKPGRPGASPSSRITQYLKACEDTLEEERARVRWSREDLTADEVREGLRLEFRAPTSDDLARTHPNGWIG